jgi:hypothetical protein
VVTPACIGCGIQACVVANDLDSLNGANITTCASQQYTPSGLFGNGCVVFTPDTLNPTTQGSTACITACNNGICDTTYIIINPPITPDTVVITPACPTCPVNACVVADDILLDANATYTSCGAPLGYTLNGISPTGCLGLTPISNGNSGITCIVACNYGLCDSTIVIIQPSVSPDTVIVTPACPTCTVSACAIVNDIPQNANTTYTTCAINGFTAVGTSNGCYTYTPTGINNTTLISCITACNNGVCDTTIVIINPPITTDTVEVQPICLTCDVTACAIFNDIQPSQSSTYNTCGLTANYTPVNVTPLGCIEFSNAGYADTIEVSCIIHCNNGLCDTTYIKILPPEVTVNPDINITSINLPVSGSVRTNDIIIPSSKYFLIQANINNPSASLPVLQQNGNYTFVSPLSGTYYFEITNCADGKTWDCKATELKITVFDTSVTNKPIVNTDIAVTQFGLPVSINTLANDTSINIADPLNPATVTIIAPPLFGIANVDPINGKITYNPSSGYFGTDTLEYEVCTSISPVSCDRAKQIITVLDPSFVNTINASDDFGIENKGVPIIGNVLLNDNDPEGDLIYTLPISYSLPGIGSLNLTSNGNYTFTPVITFNGAVDLIYQVCDNNPVQACASATIYLYYNNQLPVNLPVQSIILYGTAMPNHDKLVWRTIGETETKHFELQRSTDKVNYSYRASLPTQAPGGTYLGMLEYMHNDNEILEGDAYYRVKVVSEGNRFNYSNVVHIYRQGGETFSLYPNPTVSDAYIYALLNNDADITIRVFDAAGKLVNIISGNYPVGANTIDINTQSMAYGMYTVELSVGGFVKLREKLIKQ